MTDTDFGPEYDISEWSRNLNGEIPDENEGTKPLEIKPKISTSPLDKVKTWTNKVSKDRAVKPKATYARVSVGSTISRGWSLLAQMAQPINMPVARTMAMQAPVAGAVLEQAVQGTIIDRILQPLARAEGKGEAITALIGPPLIVGALSIRPEAHPVLVPALRETLKLWVKVAGKEIEKLAQEKQEYEETDGPMIEAMIAYLLQGILEPAEQEVAEIPLSTPSTATRPMPPRRPPAKKVAKKVSPRVPTAA